MKNSIIGGVSPLKARKGKKVAGKVGIKATNVRAQDRSGFSRSGKVPSGKGYMSNLESLTAGTRLTSSLADTLKYKDPGTKDAIKGKKDFGKTGDFEKTDDLSPEREERTITEEGKTGNRFYDACHNADGSRKAVGSVGTTTWTEIDKETGKEVTKSKSFECKWGGSSSGRHNYTNKQTSKDQFRTREDKNSDWGPWQDK